MALKCRRYSKENKPSNLIFHSDGGGQYYAVMFIEQLRLLGIKSSMAEDVYENAIAERVNGIIKNNYLVHRSMNSYVQLKKELDRSVALYNSQKPHRSLKNETPISFELKMMHVCNATKTEDDELINGKLKKKGASSPISSWQQKPQTRNLSPEIQV
jgi:transposase InsO family protein